MRIQQSKVADIEAALALAEQADVYLMLTLFSFDAFAPDRNLEGLPVPSLRPIVLDDSRRAALMQNVVQPLAMAVASSPHADRMIA